MKKIVSRGLTSILILSLLLGGMSGLGVVSVRATNDKSGYGITQFVMDGGDAVHEKKIMSLGADIEYKAIIEYKKNNKPTLTPTPTSTPTPKATLTPTPTLKPRATATPRPRVTATPRPRVTATPRPIATATPRPRATATPRPTATPKPQPTSTPKPQPTSTPKPAPTTEPAPPEPGPVVPQDPEPVVPQDPDLPTSETALSHIRASVESLFGAVRVSASTVKDTGTIYITDTLHESLEYKQDSVIVMDKDGETVATSKYKVEEEGQELNISFDDDAFDVDGASITFKANIKSDYDISKLDGNIIPNVVEMTTKGGNFDGKSVKSKEVKIDTANIQKPKADEDLAQTTTPKPTVTIKVAEPGQDESGNTSKGGIIIALLAGGIVIAVLALVLTEISGKKKIGEDNEGLEKEE